MDSAIIYYTIRKKYDITKIPHRIPDSAQIGEILVKISKLISRLVEMKFGLNNRIKIKEMKKDPKTSW